MLDIDVKNGQNLALRSQFLPPIAIVRQADRGSVLITALCTGPESNE